MLMDQTAHNKAELLFCTMARVVHKAEGDAAKHSKIVAAYEDSMTRVMLKEYQKVAESAVTKGLSVFNGRDTEAQAKQIINVVSKEMSKFGSDSMISTLEKQLEGLYEEVTGQFLKQFKIGTKVRKATFTAESEINFNLQDKQAIESVQRLSAQTAGRYFPDHLQSKVSEVVRATILERGLPIKDAARILENELRGALGVIDEVVPSRFKNNPQQYFELVASNASVTSTSLSRLISMSDAGIDKFKITAIIDRRTSTICRGLDGKEFSVEKAMTGVEKFFGIENLDQLESSFGFSKDGSTPKWAAQGLGFPPYHHGCRTTVVPII